MVEEGEKDKRGMKDDYKKKKRNKNNNKGKNVMPGQIRTSEREFQQKLKIASCNRKSKNDFKKFEEALPLEVYIGRKDKKMEDENEGDVNADSTDDSFESEFQKEGRLVS